jgi:hypothetical protein
MKRRKKKKKKKNERRSTQRSVLRISAPIPVFPEQFPA